MSDLNVISHEIRSRVKRMIYMSGGGHAGGSLSIAEILACLYFSAMDHKPDDPQWQDRDRFILSKGHSGLGLYAVLALAGYFPESWLDNFAGKNGVLMNHPDSHNIPGVEVSTGSLGHGFPIAAGMALAAKLKGENHFVFTLLGDGECHEGTVWEAAMASTHYRLDRFVAIVDRNHIGNDGDIDKIINLKSLSGKFKAFGWKTFEIDGHNTIEISDLLLHLKKEAKGPYAIIAKTVKGKGLISEIADTGKSHYIQGSKREIDEMFLL